MEEKKIIYEIILSIWNIAKEVGFEKLSDKQWELLIEKANSEKDKIKEQGRDFELLFREMFFALQNYYERKKDGKG